METVRIPRLASDEKKSDLLPWTAKAGTCTIAEKETVHLGEKGAESGGL
jgi:hypothetical protein